MREVQAEGVANKLCNASRRCSCLRSLQRPPRSSDRGPFCIVALIAHYRFIGPFFQGAGEFAFRQPFRVEIGQQRKMDVVASGIVGMTPRAVDGDAPDLRVAFAEFGPDLVVESHLIAAHRASVGRIEGNDEATPFELRQGE